MSSFWQLVRLTFWMRPLQRALVALAVLAFLTALLLPVQAVTPGLQAVSPGMPGIWPLLSLGMSLMLVSPLCTSGVLLRNLSAQRGVQLLPHARIRLLAGTFALMLVTSLLLLLAIYMAQRPVPPEFRPDAGFYAMTFVVTFTFVTQVAIGFFIGSRSPFWALVVLLGLQLPGLAMRLAGIEQTPQLITGPVGLALLAGTWVVFGAWYLSTSSISAAGWRGGARMVWHGGARTLSRDAGSRDEAMQRWLLGALTPMRASLFWLACAALVVGIQLLFGRYSSPPVVTAIVFATLSLAANGVFGVAFSIAQRSRGLWLLAGHDRESLHARCERLMLKYAVHVGVPLALAGIILWQWLPARPALPAPFVALSTLAMMLAMGWLGLAQLQRSRWPDLLVGGGIMLVWAYALALPLIIREAEPGWTTLFVQFGLVVAMRLLSRWRWRGTDWPRAQTPDPAA